MESPCDHLFCPSQGCHMACDTMNHLIKYPVNVSLFIGLNLERDSLWFRQTWEGLFTLISEGVFWQFLSQVILGLEVDPADPAVIAKGWRSHSRSPSISLSLLHTLHPFFSLDLCAMWFGIIITDRCIAGAEDRIVIFLFWTLSFSFPLFLSILQFFKNSTQPPCKKKKGIGLKWSFSCLHFKLNSLWKIFVKCIMMWIL